MNWIGNMEKILIKDLLAIGSYPEAGEALYFRTLAQISNGKEVYLDMSGVDSIPTTFMNVSFGRFIKEIGKEPTKRSLRFLNITKSQLERIKNYFELYE